MSRSSTIAAVLVVLVGVGVGEGRADPISGVLISHSGATDPTTEGWSFRNHGKAHGPVLNDEGFDAWRMDDNGNGEIAYYFPLSDSEIAAALANGWRLSVRLKVADVPDAVDAGVNSAFDAGTISFAMDFGSDSNGDPMVRLGGYHATPVTLAGLGGGYHLYEMEFSPVDSQVALVVDGVPTLTHDAWDSAFGTKRIRFDAGNHGRGEGRWNMVEFEIVPEPGATAMLVCGALGLLVIGFRRRRRAAVAMIAGAILMVGIGEVRADPISPDVVSWHASSGVLPDDPSIPAENRFSITERSYVTLRDRDTFEVSDTRDSLKVKIEKNDIGPIRASDSWACQIELRMNAHQRSIDPDFGLSFGIEDQARAGLILVASDRVVFYQTSYSAADWHEMDTTDGFHVYRIVKDLPTVSLFIDSFETPVLTIPYNQLRPESASSVEMFETSSYGTTEFDVRSFAHNLNGTVIPEPGSAAVLVCGALGLLAFGWQRRRRAAAVLIAGGILFVGVGESTASTIAVGGHALSEAAFADTLIDAEGHFTILYDPPEPGWAFTDDYALPGSPGDFHVTRDAATGYDLGTSVEIHSGWLMLGFSDPLPANGPGDDLVIYELSGGRTEDMYVTINGTKRLFDTTFTGDLTPNGGLEINEALIDLDAFGVPPGETIFAIRINQGSEGGLHPQEPDIAAVAGLNVVPEPGCVAMLACGALGLLAFGWRKQPSDTSSL